MNILDTPFEPLLDSITRLAAQICETPIALLTLVDKKRQWFKSNYGFEDRRETPREYAFCAHTILKSDVMEVADATQDPRFENNPLVTGDPAIRFYAGVPLVVGPNLHIGTLCVIDREPGHLTPDKKESLRLLAKAAVEALLVHHESA